MVVLGGCKCETAWRKTAKFETIIQIVVLEAHPDFPHRVDPLLLLRFTTCLLLFTTCTMSEPTFYYFFNTFLQKLTTFHLDVPFRTVSRGSPGPLGSVLRRFEEVRGSWRKLGKVWKEFGTCLKNYYFGEA